MELKINAVIWTGLIIAVIGVGLHLSGYVTHSVNGISVFPFVMIPVGVLVSLLGFMKKRH